MLTRILLALDGTETRRRVRRLLDAQRDVLVESLEGRAQIGTRIAREECDLVLLSRSLLPDPAAENLACLREAPDPPAVVVLSDEENAEETGRLLAAGCFAVLDSRLDEQVLGNALATLISRRREETQAVLDLPTALDEPRLSDFISSSPAMQSFMEVVQRIVNNDATLLITGETGVGKERLAQAIHAEGPRSSGPFVPVNCGAIPETLLESELFGHEKGAFTGATRTRRGWFELAHHGTVFLDEIGEMPVHLQVKLLRVLQTRQVVPVGSEKSVQLDVRVVAATNRNLEDDVKAKTFRPDLFYRLSVITLEMPPLRERKEDIPKLVERYIEYFQSGFSTTVRSISRDALAALVAYPWPGNVREFTNVIERAMLLCPGEEITAAELPQNIIASAAVDGERSGFAELRSSEPLPSEWLRRPLREVKKEVVDDLERRYLKAMLEATRGRIGEAARKSGLNPRNLFEKMRQLGLRKEDFRSLAD